MSLEQLSARKYASLLHFCSEENLYSMEAWFRIVHTNQFISINEVKNTLISTDVINPKPEVATAVSQSSA